HWLFFALPLFHGAPDRFEKLLGGMIAIFIEELDEALDFVELVSGAAGFEDAVAHDDQSAAALEGNVGGGVADELGEDADGWAEGLEDLHFFAAGGAQEERAAAGTAPVEQAGAGDAAHEGGDEHA